MPRKSVQNSPALVSRRSFLFGGALGAAGLGGLTLLSDPAPAGASTAVTNGLPSYAVTVAANVYDSTRCVYNWKASNTRRHRAGLAHASTGGTTSQLFIGDSLTTGAINLTTLTMDRPHAWPRAYAATLGSLGYPSGGSGLVRIMDGTLRDDRWTVSGSWTGGSTSAYAASAGASATMTVPDSGTSVAVVFVGTSATTFSVSVDGATSGAGYLVVPTGGAAGVVRRVVLNGLADKPHVVKVTSLSSGALALIGAEVFRSTGLVCHNVAQGGSTAGLTGQGSWTDTNAVFGSRLLPLFKPGSGAYGTVPTTVHCALGANDIGKGSTPDQVAAAITTLRNACPNSDFILYFEPLPAASTAAVWAPFGTRMYALADALDVPLVDLNDRLGGYTVEAANGLTGDTVAHLNAAGYAEWGRSAALIAAS